MSKPAQVLKVLAAYFRGLAQKEIDTALEIRRRSEESGVFPGTEWEVCPYCLGVILTGDQEEHIAAHQLLDGAKQES